MATQISKNFTLEELRDSATAKKLGIINAPGVDEVCALCALVHHVLQPLRDWANEPVNISSGYRCSSLNKAVGGVSNSQHVKGEAADIDINDDIKKGRKWMTWIMDNCDFDQLIMEHNAAGTYWVHVSYRADGKNRRQVISDLLKK